MGPLLGGRVALVTGSSSGIGAAIASAFASGGASVVVNSASSTIEGTRLADELPNATYVQADVSDPADANRLVNATVERFGRLDILVNNAAASAKVIRHADLDTVTNDMWDRVLRTNVVGPWNVIRAARPHLRDSGDGVIINISSVAGIRPGGSSIPYAVSKAALNHLTILLANALGPEIRVLAVAPGFVETPRTADWDTVRESIRKSAPLRRSGTPEDIADACVGLLAARYSTGQVLLVDGGMALR